MVFNALSIDWPLRGTAWATVVSTQVLVTGKRINKTYNVDVFPSPDLLYSNKNLKTLLYMSKNKAGTRMNKCSVPRPEQAIRGDTRCGDDVQRCTNKVWIESQFTVAPRRCVRVPGVRFYVCFVFKTYSVYV